MRRALRWTPLAVYALAAAYEWHRHGVPLLEDRLIPWLLGLILALSFTDLRRFCRGILVDWLPFVAALTFYDLVRGIADGRLLPAHAHPQLWVDKYVFGFGTVPTVFLQKHLWDPTRLHWYDYATWGVYMTHFFATPLLAAALWLWAPHRFRRYVILVVGISFAAMVTYVLYPAMPPWLASQSGDLPPLSRIIEAVTLQLPYLDGRALFEQGTAWANDIAAMPSLHEGLALLLTLTLWPLANRPVRVLLALYPVAMAFALVYSGEHYVVEVVAGCVYTLGVTAVVNWASVRRRSRVSRVAASRHAPAESAPSTHERHEPHTGGVASTLR
jgi:hypothetical protein